MPEIRNVRDVSIESEEPAVEPPSVEQRLSVAEAKIAWLERESKHLVWVIVAVAGFGILMFIAVSLWPVTGPPPTDRDATLEELLADGVHCYDSAQERGAARQRALAAIDRIKWEREREQQESADSLWGTQPSAKLPSLREKPIDGESWDEALCFRISYDRFG